MSSSSKSGIRTSDIAIIDKVFEMESGWVLNFSDRTFAAFFDEELGVNIDLPRYSAEGGSKAKRLRYYLRHNDNDTALCTLNALWDYRRDSSVVQSYSDLDDGVVSAYKRIIERLCGKPAEPKPVEKPEAAIGWVDPSIADKLSAMLLEVSNLAPQARGFAFEKFLKEFFDAYDLSARASFRIRGEQIDGSFVLVNRH